MLLLFTGSGRNQTAGVAQSRAVYTFHQLASRAFAGRLQGMLVIWRWVISGA